jgi:hypothetical protein
MPVAAGVHEVKVLFRAFVFVVELVFLIALTILGPGIVRQSSNVVASVTVPNQIILTPVVTGLADPILVNNPRDGSHRLFITEIAGIIKVLQPGASTPTVFLDIRSRVVAAGELGLLGLAFHPQYQTNRRFFVHYTRNTDAANVIAEYRVSASNPNVAELTETVLLVVTDTESNHNGGMIEFGRDGYLYIGLGDGGLQNDPQNRAQNINDPSGKILRIDVDHPNGNVPYSSPPDNPFAGPIRGLDEIYSIGMRNPWRFSFDRGTGQLWIGDVGQGQFEEIDIGQLGGNFGWRVYEGAHCTNLDPQLCNTNGFVAPLAEYAHANGRCSITGGYVYRGFRSSVPPGAYIYGDFCTGEILMLQGGSQTTLLDTSLLISSFGEDEVGEIYLTSLNSVDGAVWRIVNPNAPVLRNKPPDFDGDGKTDLSVFRPGAGVWYIRQSLNGAFRAHSLGSSTDRIVPGDYDGDGKTDVAVFQPNDGTWCVLQSSNNSLISQSFGSNGDLPVPRDYDGDGKTDLAVFRPAGGVWYILQTTNNTVRAQHFGIATDRQVPADYDGDLKADVAVFRNGSWYIQQSTSGAVIVTQFGDSTDRTVAADYDGDGKADIAVYRPSSGTWYLLRSSLGFEARQFGLATDQPAPGDYDGDGKCDIGVYRNGIWYVLQSDSGTLRSEQFGIAGDIATPSSFVQ